MKKFVLALSAAALALGAGGAYAAAGKANRGLGPQGDMTWAEMQAKAGTMFDRMDVNHDGVINQADRDARKLEMFDKIDTNHDGMISKDEFLAAKRPDRPGPDAPRMAGAGGPGMTGPGGPGGPGMAGPGRGRHSHGMRGGPDGMGMMLMRMADANKDGSVTRAEFDAAVKAHFDEVDTNHDGKITRAERMAAHQKMRAEMRAKMGKNAPAGAPDGDMPPPPPPGDDDE